jgi:hypothetical protein
MRDAPSVLAAVFPIGYPNSGEQNYAGTNHCALCGYVTKDQKTHACGPNQV